MFITCSYVQFEFTSRPNIIRIKTAKYYIIVLGFFYVNKCKIFYWYGNAENCFLAKSGTFIKVVIGSGLVCLGVVEV